MLKSGLKSGLLIPQRKKSIVETTISLFSPPPIGGLVSWWEADRGVTLDTTNAITTVSSVIDQSPSSPSGINNAVQPNKTSQPRLIKLGLNGQPIFRFNGTSSHLKTNGGSYSAKMIIALFRQNKFSDFDGIVTCRKTNSAKNAISNEDTGFTGVQNTVNISGFEIADAIYIDGTIANLNNYNNFSVGATLTNNTNFHLIEVIKNSSVAGSKYWVIGADTFSTDQRFFNGDLALLLIYSVVDDTTRLAARQYAKEKYALEIT